MTKMFNHELIIEIEIVTTQLLALTAVQLQRKLTCVIKLCHNKIKFFMQSLNFKMQHNNVIEPKHFLPTYLI